MAAAGGAAVALAAGANGSSGAAHSVEEAVLAVCKQHEQVRSTRAAARGTPPTLTLRFTAPNRGCRRTSSQPHFRR